MLNWIFGGGCVATIAALITLKSTVQQAKADAERAKAEADRAKADAERAKADSETVRIDNAEHATRILIDNIVEPLKKELNATRREMARLRKALDHANTCEYHSSCPVLHELRDLPKRDEDSDADNPDRNVTNGRARQQPDSDMDG